MKKKTSAPASLQDEVTRVQQILNNVDWPAHYEMVSKEVSAECEAYRRARIRSMAHAHERFVFAI